MSVQQTDATTSFPTSAMSGLEDSHLLAQLIGASTGLPDPVRTSPVSGEAQAIFDSVGFVYRTPPALEDLDALPPSFTIETYAFGSEATAWLYYSYFDSSQESFLVLFLAFHGDAGPIASVEGFEAHAREFLAAMTVPLNDSVASAFARSAGRTTIVFSSSVGGLPLTAANLASATYDNASGRVLAVQSWVFLEDPGLPTISSDAAASSARASVQDQLLYGGDFVTSDKIIGMRFFAVVEPLAGNVTPAVSVELRLAYEFVAEVSSDKAGQDYQVLILVDGETSGVLHVVRTPLPMPGAHPFIGPWMGALVIGLIVLVVVALCIHVSPEFAFFIFSSLVVPAYNALRGDRILDSFNRGRIYGYITAKPGSMFTEIRDALGIANGTLAYHLLVLERQELVSSQRVGRSRRFFPEGVPAIIAPDQYIGRTESVILERLVREGPLTNAAIAKALGVSKQRVHHNLRLLHRRGLVRSEAGLWTASKPAGLGAAGSPG